MNKKTVFIIIVTGILASIAIGVFFGVKYSEAVSKFKNADSAYQKASGDYKKVVGDYEKNKKDFLELRSKYDKLQKDYQALSVDRDNVLTQAKKLLSDKNKVRGLETELAKIKEENVSFRIKTGKLMRQNLNVNNKLMGFISAEREAVYERNQLAQELAKEKDSGVLRRMEKEKSGLKKENIELANNIKQSRAESGRLKEAVSKFKTGWQKSNEEIILLREKLNKFNKKYADAVKKNKVLEQKIIETPRKFVEIARQNKTLIRQTSNMHYNLGVFYMKGKEYSRAVAEFEKAVELTPDDEYSRFNLGYIYAEYLINRAKAIEHFRQFLRLAKSDDKDVDWVRKYILTWEAYDGKNPME